MQNVSVIIPAFNEEGSIAEVVFRVQTTLNGVAESEIIVVNDGSTDATEKKAKDAGALVITNPTNMGYGFSLKRGFAAAKQECVVIVDADGTYPLERLPNLLETFDKGFDMVVGARQGAHYWSSISKRFARLCFKWMSEFVVGKNIPDINSGYRVIRRSKALPVLPFLSNAFSFTTSITLIFFLKHYFISYVPVSYNVRTGKSKVRYFRDSLRSIQIMTDIIACFNPIKLFLLMAGLPALVGVLFLVITLLGYARNSMLSLISFLAALLILSLGFFATIFRIR